MPTILTHTAVPLALGLGLGPRAIPPRLLVAGVTASMVPDLDVLQLELLWVWLPAALVCAAMWVMRRNSQRVLPR
jgi:membrane-bound metal-dependent hydrolase YbcI (DUF457 family)